MSEEVAAQNSVTPAMEVEGQAAPPPEGYVEIAFAQRKWDEREAEMAAERAHLLSLLNPADSAGLAEPCDLPAPCNIDFEDDDTWNKVERGKRKALVRSSRNATQARVSLSKVSAAASPFKK